MPKEQSAPVVVRLAVRVVVRDPAALRAYARQRYRACWGEGQWEPADVAGAVLEALVTSNENPSPQAYGIEIDSVEACEEKIVAAAHTEAAT